MEPIYRSAPNPLSNTFFSGNKAFPNFDPKSPAPVGLFSFAKRISQNILDHTGSHTLFPGDVNTATEDEDEEEAEEEEEEGKKNPTKIALTSRLITLTGRVINRPAKKILGRSAYRAKVRVSARDVHAGSSSILPPGLDFGRGD